jgi:hypothetical protein
MGALRCYVQLGIPNMKLNPEYLAYHQRSFLDRLGKLRIAVAAATGAENATKIKTHTTETHSLPIPSNTC